MAITPQNGDLLAGVASQRSETINPSPDPLLTGDRPGLVSTDELVAVSQTLAAHTVVGFDDGKLVAATYSVTAAAKATEDLTFTDVGNDTETVTIDGVVYTLAASLSEAYDVLIGASATATAANLAAAINGGAGEGETYGTDTVAHPSVVASSAAEVLTATARVAGTAGNSIATTETSSEASWGAAVLSGGADAVWTGVKPIGVLIYAQTTGGGDSTVRAGVYRAGVFNPDLLVWDASFDTAEKKRLAFEGAPAPTNIVIRKPQSFTAS
jgi:hypothetical protein